MAKFYGVIGYAIQEETAPGVWTDKIVERSYRGDVLQNQNRWQSSDQVNDDFIIDNKLSIISDPYAYEHLHHIKYIKWMGATWKISKIEIQRPRLILTTGGLYNGETF
ncbi:MAG: DUF7253 family protein [Brevinema sp.]